MVYFEYDGFLKKWRVWEDRNPGDVFDLIATENLTEILKDYQFQGFTLVAGLPE